MRYMIVMTAALLTNAGQAEAAVRHATGTFEVTMAPAVDADVAAADGAKMTLAKTFSGALAGTARGVMLSAGSPASGAAGYVALERVAGTLDGRLGSFALMHAGTMDRGAFDLRVTVVPGSGAGALVGLSGTMTIRIEGGKHVYDFAYELTP